MISNRKQHIDIAKGIGIILVVLGHLDAIGQMSREIIYSFHMPLFFLLSGVFANTNIRFKDYLKKSVTTLYLPYLFFVLLDTVINSIVMLNQHKSVLELLKVNVLTLFGFHWESNILNQPLWFLFALFLIRIVFYFIDRWQPLKYIACVACIGFVFIKDRFDLPKDCIPIAAVCGLAFYIIGDLLRNVILNYDTIVEKYKDILSLMCVAIAILLVFTAHRNGDVDISNYNYGNDTLLFFYNAVLGCFVALTVSVYISNTELIAKPIAFYGANSIVVLIFHYYITRKAFKPFMIHINLEDYLYHPITQVIMLVFVMLLMIPIIYISNNYLWFLFGKKKKLNTVKKGAVSD